MATSVSDSEKKRELKVTIGPVVEDPNGLNVLFGPVVEDANGLKVYQGECRIKIDNYGVEVRVNRLSGNEVRITISIPLIESAILIKDYEELQDDLDNPTDENKNDYLDKAFFAFKDESTLSPEKEIDTKQMPSLVVTPREPYKEKSDEKYDPPLFVLRPSVEDNDANVNVNLSGTMASKIMKITEELDYPCLLVNVAPQRLGDYVIDGLINADSFHAWTNHEGSIFNIQFDLAKAKIFDVPGRTTTPEKEMEGLIKPDTKEIACLKLSKQSTSKPDQSASEQYQIITTPYKSDYSALANFSFLVLDSLIIGDAGKLHGGSGKLHGGSGKLHGGSGIVLGGAGIILGGSGNILGGAGKVHGGSAEVFTAG